jgi:hypothetical protein
LAHLPDVKKDIDLVEYWQVRPFSHSFIQLSLQAINRRTMLSIQLSATLPSTFLQLKHPRSLVNVFFQPASKLLMTIICTSAPPNSNIFK